MKTEEEKVIEGALRLPKSARAALAAQAWDTEIAKRLDEINSGKLKMIPWSEARRQIMGTNGGRQKR
jgi:hypothetical protein